MAEIPHVELKYGRSGENVRLGDRIAYRSLLTLFRSVGGRVCYVPGQNPVHPEMEYRDGMKHWGIFLENGKVITWLFAPGEFPAPRSVRFIERGDPAEGFSQGPFSDPKRILNEEDRMEREEDD